MIMRRNTALKILNPILVVLFINQVITAIFSDKLSHETFEILHEGGGTILLILIAAHFILNFNWVKANYLSK
jgi:hypothetical protein